MTSMRTTIVLIAVLVLGMLVAELGWRDASPRTQSVQVPVPRVVKGLVERLRSIPQQHVGDARSAAVTAGVVFGRAEDVPTPDQQAFLDSGLWHLLAASGQNIALVAACCILLARGIGAGRTTGAVLALGAIPLYVMVVGSGASIVRAGAMGVLGIIAWLTGRMPDTWRLVLVSACAICWVWPGAYRSLGMQLSYACVVALLAWAGPATAMLVRRGLPAGLAGAVAATMLCGLATAPVLQLRTGGAPVTGSVANLLAVPLAGALLVIGLTGSMIAMVVDAMGADRIGDAAMMPAGVLASMLLRVAHRAAVLPGAQVSDPLITMGIPAVVLVWWLVSRVGKLRPVVVRVMPLVGLALLLVSMGPERIARRTGVVRSPPLAAGVLRIAVLDIGQGDATLLAQGEHAVLVDTGPPDGRVVERVRELGVERVDGVVLTHDSLDHRGGFERVLASLHPGWTARPVHAPGPWRRVQEVAPHLVDVCAGDGFDVGDAHVRVLHPRCDGTIVPRTGDLHNDGAVVLLVEHGGVRAVLPADAEAPVLLGLGLPRIDLLRVSHHGSADPQLTQLLERVHPAIAAISVGAHNDYGHPRQQVLDDLEHAGVLVRRTDRDGTIELRSDGRTLSIVE